MTAWASAGVTISLQPQESCAAPGETFDVVLHVDEPGSGFDGYEAVVLYDPDYLEVETLSEAGMLIQGLCGNTWWWTEVGDSTIFISHVALCGGDSLTGPGPLSSMTFSAAGPLGTTAVSFQSLEFYLAGAVVPCEWTDATARIQTEPCVGACCFPDMSCLLVSGEECGDLDGDFLGYDSVCDPNPCEFSSGPDALEGERRWCEPLLLISRPNPALRGADIDFRLPEEARVQLEVIDPAGRLVATLLDERRGAGSHSVRWNGDTRAGQSAAPGVYFARLHALGAETAVADPVTRRIILLDR